jgi:hypothetical protein
MTTVNQKKFKGEIERYLLKTSHNFDSKIKEVFKTLKVKTCLCQSNIIKRDGYHSAHVLFVLIMFPLLKLETIHTFCNKHWYSWSNCKKDVFYRFKNNAGYRWRTFLYKINNQLFEKIEYTKTDLKGRYFLIDDSILPKKGKMIENVSYIHDHSIGKSVLGHCVTVLGAFTDHGTYILDFAYRFGKKRHRRNRQTAEVQQRSAGGKRVTEARNHSKLVLAEQMVKQALSKGFIPGYILFDSWYAWPSLITALNKLKKRLHVICRLKQVKPGHRFYLYQGKTYALNALYKKVKKQLKFNQKTGLHTVKISIKFDRTGEDAVIIFTKGYKEPMLDSVSGRKLEKESKWAAFLSTDTTLHASTVIMKYTKRWAIEVCFKECKQSFGLGKDQSNSFNAQVASTTISFLRYNLLNFLNQIENYQTLGQLFNGLVDDTAVVTYAHRLYEFFVGLFRLSLSKIFQALNLTEDFSIYFDTITAELSTMEAFRGCET